MSLGIVIKAPEGLVLAAESRVTLTATPPGGTPIHVNYDNATKLLSFSEPNRSVAAVTYGVAAIGLRTAHSYIPEFEAGLPPDRLGIADFAQKLSDFYMQQWHAVMLADYQGPSMTFVVGGYDEGEPYGTVCQFDIPVRPDPFEQNTGDQFGITWGGQREFVDRLIQGYDSRLVEVVTNALNLDANQVVTLTQELTPFQMAVPLQAMPLQDCVDLAVFFVRTTISAQELTVGLRGCGGPIDVAVIRRREGMTWIQQKKLEGEYGLVGQETL
jgi:hypothetical protein